MATATEVKVLANDDRRGGETLDQHPPGEAHRFLLRLGFVETHHHRGVDAGGGQQLQLLGEIGEQGGCRLGANDRGRMPIEGNHRRSRTHLGGTTADLGDDGLVPPVDPVVEAYGDHGTLPRPGCYGGVGDYLHGQKR